MNNKNLNKIVNKIMNIYKITFNNIKPKLKLNNKITKIRFTNSI
jgi:hypothetical protein